MNDGKDGERSGLDWITVEGFKSIARIEKLELRPINVLIGANGSGKSNFMKVFSLLDAVIDSAVRENSVKDYVGRAAGAERMLHFGSKRTATIKVRVAFSGSLKKFVHAFEFSMTPNETDGFHVVDDFHAAETFFLPEAEHRRAQDHRSDPDGSQYNRIGKHKEIMHKKLTDNIGRFRCYHFADTGFSSRMKKTADLHDNRHLRPDGSNLAPFLYFLREKHNFEYAFIRDMVRRIAPFFEDFRLEPHALNEDTIRLEWRHRGSDSYFDVSSLSDGTLRFVALATLLLQPPSCRPPVILVDEPELGLHPGALDLLVALVRKASVCTQIVLATQSSRMVDYFAPEDVLVADRVGGATELRRLNAETLQEWLEDYTLGDLWEMNDLGGNPARETGSRAKER